MKKSHVQLDGLIKDVLANSGVEIDAVIKRVLAQKPVRDELAKQIKNVDLDKAVNKLIMDDKGNLDVEKLLGFSIADVTLAAEDSIRAVGPQVAAPILSANDAFKACSMHSPRVKHKPAGSTVGSSGTKQNSSGDHVKGSIADGSSLDMQGVIGLGVFGLVAALLGMTALGYTLRPLIDAFVSQFQP